MASGLDYGKLMGLDRSGALNILAGNPTTQMHCGLAAGFLENRVPFTTFGDRRSAREPIRRAMPARLRCLRLGVRAIAARMAPSMLFGIS